MRPLILTLSLMLSALLLAGCARPWQNPDIPNKKQAEYQFDKDSTDCGIIASEKYPLDKDRQLPIYEQCLEDKGWNKRQKGDGYPLKN